MSSIENGWIEWNGGECPVPVGTVIQYRTRAGFESGIFAVPDWHARTCIWAHGTQYYDPSTDIIAYRIVEQSK